MEKNYSWVKARKRGRRENERNDNVISFVRFVCRLKYICIRKNLLVRNMNQLIFLYSNRSFSTIINNEDSSTSSNELFISYLTCLRKYAHSHTYMMTWQSLSFVLLLVNEYQQTSTLFGIFSFFQHVFYQSNCSIISKSNYVRFSEINYERFKVMILSSNSIVIKIIFVCHIDLCSYMLWLKENLSEK